MAEQNNGFITAKPTEGGEFTLLEAGAYDAICVGVTSRNFKKYQSEDLEAKFQFVFQINEDDKNHYLRTLPLRNVINDKSNLFTLLNSWTGVTLEKCADGIDLSQLVGCKAQIVVDEQEREGKKYNGIANILKAKKSSTVAFVPDDAAPAYLKNNLLLEKWIDGLGFAAPQEDEAKSEKADKAPKQMSGKEFLEGKAEGEDEDDDLPF
jgi:hypothetical protein